MWSLLLAALVAVGAAQKAPPPKYNDTCGLVTEFAWSFSAAAQVDITNLYYIEEWAYYILYENNTMSNVDKSKGFVKETENVCKKQTSHEKPKQRPDSFKKQPDGKVAAFVDFYIQFIFQMTINVKASLHDACALFVGSITPAYSGTVPATSTTNQYANIEVIVEQIFGSCGKSTTEGDGALLFEELKSGCSASNSTAVYYSLQSIICFCFEINEYEVITTPAPMTTPAPRSQYDTAYIFSLICLKLLSTNVKLSWVLEAKFREYKAACECEGDDEAYALFFISCMSSALKGDFDAECETAVKPSGFPGECAWIDFFFSFTFEIFVGSDEYGNPKVKEECDKVLDECKSSGSHECESKSKSSESGNKSSERDAGSWQSLYFLYIDIFVYFGFSTEIQIIHDLKMCILDVKSTAEEKREKGKEICEKLIEIIIYIGETTPAAETTLAVTTPAPRSQYDTAYIFSLICLKLFSTNIKLSWVLEAKFREYKATCGCEGDDEAYALFFISCISSALKGEFDIECETAVKPSDFPGECAWIELFVSFTFEIFVGSDEYGNSKVKEECNKVLDECKSSGSHECESKSKSSESGNKSSERDAGSWESLYCLYKDLFVYFGFSIDIQIIIDLNDCLLSVTMTAEEKREKGKEICEKLIEIIIYIGETTPVAETTLAFTDSTESTLAVTDATDAVPTGLPIDEIEQVEGTCELIIIIIGLNSTKVDEYVNEYEKEGSGSQEYEECECNKDFNLFLEFKKPGYIDFLKKDDFAEKNVARMKVCKHNSKPKKCMYGTYCQWEKEAVSKEEEFQCGCSLKTTSAP